MIDKFLKLCFSAFLFLGFSLNSFSRTDSIEISVTDSGNAVVSGANIVLRNVKTGLKRGFAADEKGICIFKNVGSDNIPNKNDGFD